MIISGIHYPFSSVGVFRYNPHRKGEIKKQKDFQLVLNIDNNIREYYHSWLIRNYGIKSEIMLPNFTTAHITVIKGNEFLLNFKESLTFLQSFEKKKCKFYYSGDIQEIEYIDSETKTKRSFFTIPAYAKEFVDIRNKVVGHEQKSYPFHVTIGRKF